MSDNDKVKFNKTINDLENKNPQQIDEIQSKHQKTKEVLIKQFNLTDEEAEEKLREIEEKHWGQPQNKSPKKKEHPFENHEKLTLKTPENYSPEEPIIPQHVLDRQESKAKPQPKPVTKEIPKTIMEGIVIGKAVPKSAQKPAVKDKKQTKKETQKPKPEQKQTKKETQKPKPEQKQTKKETQKPKPEQKQTKKETQKPKPEQKQTKKETQKPKPEQKQTKKETQKPKPEQKQTKKEERPEQVEEPKDEVKAIHVQKNPKSEIKKPKFPKLFRRNKKEKITEEPKAPQVVSDSQDIDSILGELVPNYSQDVSIELSHVDLTFEVSEDQIDNLKEQVIRTLKRNKSRTHKVHVLKDISFKIYQGEKVGVIGYNGAGKSTLLKLITGIYKPDNGTVTTNGKISPLLTLGAGFDNNFSGAKNIFLNGAILGYDREFIEEKYDEILEFAELGEKINFPIRNYSSGMKAKLGFSIATMVDPDILIIDEILGVGDINFKRKSRDKMRSLMGGKTTVILVSHSIDQIRDICDKAIWIDEGRVREIGEVNEVCDNYIKDSKKATKEQLKDIQLG